VDTSSTGIAYSHCRRIVYYVVVDVVFGLTRICLIVSLQCRLCSDHTDDSVIVGLHSTSMSEARCLSFLVSMIGVMMSLEVDAQPTVDDGTSCESSAQDETVINLINRGFTDMKNILGSLQLQQSRGAVDSSSLCEYKSLSHKCVGLMKF